MEPSAGSNLVKVAYMPLGYQPGYIYLLTDWVLKKLKELVLIYNYVSQKNETVKELGREPLVLS
jgi:hypothetical protein